MPLLILYPYSSLSAHKGFLLFDVNSENSNHTPSGSDAFIRAREKKIPSLSYKAEGLINTFCKGWKIVGKFIRIFPGLTIFENHLGKVNTVLYQTSRKFPVSDMPNDSSGLVCRILMKIIWQQKYWKEGPTL